jgi:hypothetical protein
MHTTWIKQFAEEDQKVNSHTLFKFECAYSACDLYTLMDLLHPEGRFFERMSRDRACGFFQNVFFGREGTSKKFNLEICRGITTDAIPGENVVEFRSSNFDPFADDIAMLDKELGELPDKRIQEIVHRFAFSFKDHQIYTIRVPLSYSSEKTRLTLNN